MIHLGVRWALGASVALGAACSSLPASAVFRCAAQAPRCPEGLSCRAVDGVELCVPVSADGGAGGVAGGSAGGFSGGSAGGQAGSVAGGGSAGGQAGSAAGGGDGGGDSSRDAGVVAGGEAGGATGGGGGVANGGGAAGGCSLSPLAPGATIYVSAATGLDVNDGSLGRPVSTVERGLKLASEAGLETIAIMPGRYSVELEFTSGVTRLVGVTPAGARTCDEQQFARLESTRAVGLTVSGGVVSLEQLQVVAQPALASQRSSYGAWVRGGSVTFVDVRLVAGDGASGSTPAPASPPPGHACDGLMDCSDGGAGGSGQSGAPSDGGTFGLAGYVPGDGALGVAGQRGQNGTASVRESYGNCVSSCTGATPCDHGNLFCGAIGFGSVTSVAGLCGCGAAGANPGAPGTGGGASIALLVTGMGAATVTGGLLLAATGGAGALGGQPSTPGAGTAGTSGSSATCPDFGAGATCSRTQCVATCQPTGPTRTVRSSLGGQGGGGGRGGLGGGGSGGPSVGAARVGGAMLLVSPQTRLVTGAPGVGAGGARDGFAVNQLSWP